ncbi:uncharacterized protein TM35_000112140 [Trypanosoma theileri]|uniref:Uncharacterized protein n=1 Tax=Trypanosoma theileri TaxID=67003 RepID=A0A1X0NZU8_9TRYP|nr:uncharacterized protein TM35_000112140 [Trypanosoma theileri]ORC89680.1 hypothetical protein TM35_000112140 [Trypanosoma theileri]
MNKDENNHGGGLHSRENVLEHIFESVEQMRNQRSAWNEELGDFFLTEAKQKRETESLTRRVKAGQAITEAGGAFHKWMERRVGFGLGEEMIREWFHIDTLLALTPFVAFVPCPRSLSEKGKKELVQAVDALELIRFMVQTVPVHFPLSKIAPTFVSSPYHQHETERISKSNLGDLSYVGLPCTYGGDALNLIANDVFLSCALYRTPCLFLNDHVPRVSLCIHSITVGGLCVAAEVACNIYIAEKLNLDDIILECKESSEEITALALALKNFVEGQIVPSIGKRSFHALLLGELPIGEKDSLITSNTHFSLLNLDTLDECEFECFTQDDIFTIARRMTNAHDENKVLPTVLRFLKRRPLTGCKSEIKPHEIPKMKSIE